MDVWMSVGGVIGQKLAEIGEERMFKHLHEAVLSGLTLDVADFKESMAHKLIHMVWRKKPRNKDNFAGNVMTKGSWSRRSRKFHRKKRKGEDDEIKSSSSEVSLFLRLSSLTIFR